MTDVCLNSNANGVCLDKTGKIPFSFLVKMNVQSLILAMEVAIMKRLMYVLVLLLACGFVFAGPFGVEMGWFPLDFENAGIALTEFSKSNNITSYYFTPKDSHPSFARYIVRIDSQYGTYDINAKTDSIESSSFGTAVKNEFEEIKDQLAMKYGKPQELDFLMPGSIWKEPEDWMMSLYKEERYLFSFWEEDQNNPNTIGLEAIASDRDSAFLELTYQSPQTHEIIERSKKAKASVF